MHKRAVNQGDEVKEPVPHLKSMKELRSEELDSKLPKNTELGEDEEKAKTAESIASLEAEIAGLKAKHDPEKGQLSVAGKDEEESVSAVGLLLKQNDGDGKARSTNKARGNMILAAIRMQRFARSGVVVASEYKELLSVRTLASNK